MRVDIVIEITAHMGDPTKDFIRTNAKPEAIEEVLDAWLRGQIGRGKDDAKPVRREAYTIKIGLAVEDDSFGVESDTGNKGLTAGIVLDIRRRLESVPVRPLV